MSGSWLTVALRTRKPSWEAAFNGAASNAWFSTLVGTYIGLFNVVPCTIHKEDVWRMAEMSALAFFANLIMAVLLKYYVFQRIAIWWVNRKDRHRDKATQTDFETRMKLVEHYTTI